MNTQTLNGLPPINFEEKLTKHKAIQKAEELSNKYRGWSIYVFFNLSGYYRVDYFGYVPDDEKHEATYYNGEKI